MLFKFGKPHLIVVISTNTTVTYEWLLSENITQLQRMTNSKSLATCGVGNGTKPSTTNRL